MRTFNCFAVFTVATLLLSFSGAKSPPIVEIKQGAVQGIKSKSLNGNDFYSFMGIPYAKPPVGKLRFKEPVVSKPWNGTLDGTKMPDSCLQYSMSEFFFQKDKTNVSILGKEDCLYLNVYTPKPNNETANLTVMIYIHDGGFVSGGAIDAPPNALMDKDIVLVVLQYRLGVLGFLSTEDKELPGNIGLKDQQLAIKWVKHNIAPFGGNSSRVTLFGEGAGSISTFMQMITPGNKDLFHRIIAQSGTPHCPFATSKKHKQYAVKLGNTFNCPLGNSTEEYIECMQKIDGNDLIKFMLKEVVWGFSPAHMLPRMDKSFFPEHYESHLRKMRYNKVDIITGITKDEGLIMYLMMKQNPWMVDELNNNFDVVGPLSLGMYGEDAIEDATKVYQYYLERDTINDIDLEKDRDKLLTLFTDRYYGVCHDSTSFFLGRNNINSLYRYQLDYRSEKKSLASAFSIPKENDWVAHGDDLFHIFSGPPMFVEPEKQDENDVFMRDLIISAWTNFAETGKPISNSSDYDFKWVRASHRNSLAHLSLSPTPKMEKFTKKESRKFWLKLEPQHNPKKHPGNKKPKSNVPKDEL